MRHLLFMLIVFGAVTASRCGDGAASAPSPIAAGEIAASEIAEPEFRSIEDLEDAALKRDVPYVPTRQETVDEMLRMAKVSRSDVVFDLGSGDGRIVITAAQRYGARGVGIDIDPQRILEANENAKQAGVTDKVRFIQGDLFEADLGEATAVTLYLLRSVNIRLRPKLLAELRPGTPVVSHDFDMGEWQPEEHKQVNSDDVYLWIIPARVEGQWRWKGPGGVSRTAQLQQEFQKFSGTMQGGDDTFEIRDGTIRGEEISFEAVRGGVVERYRGKVKGGTIQGQVEAGKTRSPWRAEHE